LGLSKYKRKGIPPGNIYTFADQKLTNSEFAAFIETRGSRINTKDPAYFIKESAESMISDQIISYENSSLEKKYPDFRYLMNEFHDGILLFDISGKKIWDRVQEDSAGFMKYYEDNKNKYLSERGIEARIYTLRSENSEKKLWSAYKKYSKKEGGDSMLISKFNRTDSLLVIKQGIWYAGEDPELDKLEWVRGVVRTKINNYPSIIAISRIIEPSPLPAEEVRGEMMAGFQEYLENEWIIQLKAKYNVKIDDLVLNEVRKWLNDE
jgi:peptidyl-prolyl cis-trans isomerase SurA